jgi:sugar lactone lactonase YvrE
MKNLYIFSALAWATIALQLAGAHTVPSGRLPLPHETIFQFSKSPVWIENFAVRRNGDLLFTTIGDGALYSFDPLSKEASAQLVYSFLQAAGLDATLGITEYSPDVFAVIAGKSEGFTGIISGSASIWKVDLRRAGHAHTAKVSKIVDLPQAIFPNGIITLPPGGDCETLLISDSALGAVWALDVRGGNVEIAIQVPEMAPPPDAPLPLGINGIKILDGYLYWTNSFRGTLNRVRIDLSGHHIATGGDVEIVSSTGLLLDDFSFDGNGNAWVAANGNNTIIVVDPETHDVVPVVGGNTLQDVEGPTATHFGGLERDRQTLYVTTSGGLALPINGTITEAGKIVAIDTRSFWI